MTALAIGMTLPGAAWAAHGFDLVVTGPAAAYPGDRVTLRAAVTSRGNAPLRDDVLADSAFACAPVTPDGDARRAEGDEDDEARPASRVWRFVCSASIPADHKAGDPNPVAGVMTATARAGRRLLSASTAHETQVLHPAVAIDVTGPTGVDAGDTVAYTVDVTNPGDVAFAAGNLTISALVCPSLDALRTNGDPTPASLDPGERWSWSCAYRTHGTEPPLVNRVAVDAVDANGHAVHAQDSLTTYQRQVAATTYSARLRLPAGCPRRAFRADVTGASIARVAFSIDGRRRTTVRRPDGRGRWSLRIRPRGVRYGRHRVRAVVSFNGGGASRRLTAIFVRCRRDRTPTFTR